MCREFFTLDFGIVDYDLVLDTLCIGIHACNRDRDYIRSMVYGDMLFQGHHEPLDDRQNAQLMQFFVDIRSRIVRQVHEDARVPQVKHIQYVATNSRMSLKFEVLD